MEVIVMSTSQGIIFSPCIGKGLKEGKCHTKEEGSDSFEVMPSLQDEYILQMPRISLLEVEDWWVI